MNAFIKVLIDTIRGGRSSDIDEATLQAGFVFEKYNGLGENKTLAEQIRQFGWSQEVGNTFFSEEDVTRLREALIDCVRQAPTRSEVGGAIWALGKLNDPTLKPIFVEALQEQIVLDAVRMYQVMIALNNLGEDIFGDETSMTVFNSEDNRALAKAYLQRQGY